MKEDGWIIKDTEGVVSRETAYDKITKNISLGVSTVETNRDRDFSICWDQLLKPVEIIFSVEKRLFFCLGGDF